jgi:hypothetical protein
MMKNPRLVLLVAVSLLAGCSRSTFDVAADRVSLLKRDAEWADAASNGKDVEKIISYWTDDALVVPPGQPVVEGGGGRGHVEDVTDVEVSFDESSDAGFPSGSPQVRATCPG